MNNSEMGTMSAIDSQVTQILDVIDRLARLIDEENSELARGIPAQLAHTAEEKATLSAQLEAYVIQVKEQAIDLGDANDDVREILAQRSQELATAMDENMNRLRAAMQASRFRVETIMRAIREQQGGGDTQYDSTGTLRIPSSRRANSGISV